MKRLYLGPVLFLIVLVAVIFGGCTSTTASNTTTHAVVTPAPVVTHMNTTTATPVPVPTRVNLTPEDKVFLKDAVDQGGISITMIGNTLALIQGGRYDSARVLAESVEKNLKSQYNNLSAQPVSPAIQPVKDEILEAIRDEINGSRKLRNIAISDSEGMLGASRDYRDAADALFRSANLHLNNAQSKINAFNK